MQDNGVSLKEKYNLVIQNFEGPLDLLLHLITKHKMDIFDISLSELTDKYIEYLNKMNELNLDVASDFVVMASMLLDIKAKKLLPEMDKKDDEEVELTEEDIISRIIEYKKYKEISNTILEMYNNNFGSFTKPFEKIKYNSNTSYDGEKFSTNKIHDIYIWILQRNKNKINKNAKEIEKIAVYEKYTVQDKVKQIVKYLNNNKSMIFNNMYSVDKCNNIEIVTAFLGALELSKLKKVGIEQDYLFSDIVINKKKDFDMNFDISKIDE